MEIADSLRGAGPEERAASLAPRVFQGWAAA